MLAGFPKYDLFHLAMPIQVGYAGYFKTGGYALAPPGDCIPYTDSKQEHAGYHFNAGGGSAGPNVFGEGAVIPSTWPTNWECPVASGVGVSVVMANQQSNYQQYHQACIHRHTERSRDCVPIDLRSYGHPCKPTHSGCSSELDGRDAHPGSANHTKHRGLSAQSLSWVPGV